MTENKSDKLKGVNPFLLKKWERIFYAFFDRNASDEVDWGDFYLVTRFVRDIYGLDSEQMQLARSSMKALWEGLLSVGDRNKDDKIQLDEWCELIKKSEEHKEKNWLVDYQNFMFKLFDVSCDNVLDLAEYTDGMATYGFEPGESHDAFHKFAVDDKGHPIPAISLPQFRKLWNDYFYSTKKDALGNYLFGKLEEHCHNHQ